jgi:hypothetical protein
MIVGSVIVLSIIISIIVLTLCNRWLPVWFCNHLGWHVAPKEQGYDGASLYGRCPRCHKRVLQDSQCNWFEA